LEDIRTAAKQTAKGEEKPHWVLADAATEIEAARVMTMQAAQTLAGDEGSTGVALARLMASTAAQHAVDAALRIAGADGLREGAFLERLARDVRAVSLVLGTEEDQRAVAAQGLFES
jgi:alkylation response protein AidB-like acyl-CoA dehydrogenase